MLQAMLQAISHVAEPRMAMLNLTQGDWLRFDRGQKWATKRRRIMTFFDGHMAMARCSKIEYIESTKKTLTKHSRRLCLYTQHSLGYVHSLV